MNIKFRTQRQFDAVLRKEGKTITDYLSDAEYRVFFRQMKHSDNTSSKVRIYYSKDLPISRGTIFTIYNETYIIVNQDSIESEIYNTSVAVRTTQFFRCGNALLPFVVSDLKNVYPTGGSVMSVVGGSITVYTQDCEAFRSVKVNDTYIAFGGTYKVLNTFYNDGIGYLYLSRAADSTRYTLEYTGVNRIDLADANTYQLSFVAKQGDAVDETAVLTYTSSDDTIATVDATGLATFATEGTVIFTATWLAHSVSSTVEMTVVDSSEEPEREVTCVITYTGGDNKLRIGGSYKTFDAAFYEGGEPIAFKSGGVWSFDILKDGETEWKPISYYAAAYPDLTDIVYVSESEIKIKIPDEDNDDFIGDQFKVTYTADGISGSAIMLITGIWG